jgi:hypothetical protein
MPVNYPHQRAPRNDTQYRLGRYMRPASIICPAMEHPSPGKGHQNKEQGDPRPKQSPRESLIPFSIVSQTSDLEGFERFIGGGQ